MPPTYAYTSTPLAHQHVRLLAANNASLQAELLELLASIITNDSSVAGATVKDAIESLAAADACTHVVRSVADLPPPLVGTHDLTSGSWCFAASVDVSNTIVVPAGVTVLIDGLGWEHVLSSNNTVPLSVSGIAHLRNLHMVANIPGNGVEAVGGTFDAVHCRFVNLGGEAALVVNGTVLVSLTECEHESSGSCIRIYTVTGSVDVVGGRWRGTNDGLLVSGNVTRGLRVVNVLVETGIIDGIQRAAGTVSSVSVVGCRFESTNGIVWAAASMPSLGLTAAANTFSSATPFSGFTSATARVNLKGNLGPAGLLSETAIVP